MEHKIRIEYSIWNILNIFKYFEDAMSTNIPEDIVKIFINDEKKFIS